MSQNMVIGIVVVAVVVAVLVVAVVIPALTYMAVMNNLPPTTTSHPTIVLQSSNWNAGYLPINIQSATGSSVNPSDLTFIVADRNGTTCYSGSSNLNLSTCGATVNVVYQDNINVGRVSAGDSIRISVYPTTSQVVVGGRLRVFYQNSEIGTTVLP